MTRRKTTIKKEIKPSNLDTIISPPENYLLYLPNEVLFLIMSLLNCYDYTHFQNTCKTYYELLHSEGWQERVFKDYCIKSWNLLVDTHLTRCGDRIHQYIAEKFHDPLYLYDRCGTTWSEITGHYLKRGVQFISDYTVLMVREQKGKNKSPNKHIGTRITEIEGCIYRGEMQVRSTKLYHILPYGNGILWNENNNVLYTGSFLYGQFHGVGKITYVDNDENYETTWSCGVPEGDVNCQQIRDSISNGICINKGSQQRMPHVVYRRKNIRGRICESCFKNCTDQDPDVYSREWVSGKLTCFCKCNKKETKRKIKKQKT